MTSLPQHNFPVTSFWNTDASLEVPEVTNPLDCMLSMRSWRPSKTEASYVLLFSVLHNSHACLTNLFSFLVLRFLQVQKGTFGSSPRQKTLRLSTLMFGFIVMPGHPVVSRSQNL